MYDEGAEEQIISDVIGSLGALHDDHILKDPFWFPFNGNAIMILLSREAGLCESLLAIIFDTQLFSWIWFTGIV